MAVTLRGSMGSWTFAASTISGWWGTWMPTMPRIPVSLSSAQKRPVSSWRGEFTKPICKLAMSAHTMKIRCPGGQRRRGGGNSTMRALTCAALLSGLDLTIAVNRHLLSIKIAVPILESWIYAGSPRMSTITTNPGGRWSRCCTLCHTGIIRQGSWFEWWRIPTAMPWSFG